MIREAAPGVGIMFNPVVPEFLREHPASVDYVAVIPETLWLDRGPGVPGRFRDIPAAVRELDDVVRPDRRLVVHGIGLSIGSALPLDRAHLRRIEQFLRRYRADGYSEHLAFSRVASSEHEAGRNVAAGFPIPCDEDVLLWLADRVKAVQDALAMPLILENSARYTPPVDEDLTEPRFLNQLSDCTGCGVLLDLHNLYTSVRACGIDAHDYLSQLNLDNVIEIHVAGGSMLGNTYTDSHSGPSPPSVWEYAREVVPRCGNLAGVTFEFHESYYPAFGPERLVAELGTIRELLRDVA